MASDKSYWRKGAGELLSDADVSDWSRMGGVAEWRCCFSRTASHDPTSDPRRASFGGGTDPTTCRYLAGDKFRI